jgi:hypothetical protein
MATPELNFSASTNEAMTLQISGKRCLQVKTSMFNTPSRISYFNIVLNPSALWDKERTDRQLAMGMTPEMMIRQVPRYVMGHCEFPATGVLALDSTPIWVKKPTGYNNLNLRSPL